MPTEKASAPARKKLEFRRGEDFKDYYANNCQLMSNAWDLKITFGQLDEAAGPNNVVQDHSVRLSWPQAKILLFFLQVHVFGHEADFAHIDVPKNIIPEFAKEPPEGANLETWRALRKVYEDFVSANPEAIAK